MNCPICRSTTVADGDYRILARHTAELRACTGCGYRFFASPAWLEEAYRDPINIFDTGLVFRNLRLARIVAAAIALFGLRAGKFLDFSGGYGLFVRLMRDRGFDFFWSDRHTSNLMARGFEDRAGSYDLITCFEVIEHVADPLALLRELLQKSPRVLIATELQPALWSRDWEYIGPEHGQHIGFHTRASLAKLAEAAGVGVVSQGDMHLFGKSLPSPLLWSLAVRLGGRFGDCLRGRGKAGFVEDARALKSLQ